MTTKEATNEVLDALGIVAFLSTAMSGIASAASQTVMKDVPMPDTYVPVIQLDHIQAHGLTMILSALEIKLTDACDSLVENESDAEVILHGESI